MKVSIFPYAWRESFGGYSARWRFCPVFLWWILENGEWPFYLSMKLTSLPLRHLASGLVRERWFSRLGVQRCRVDSQEAPICERGIMETSAALQQPLEQHEPFEHEGSHYSPWFWKDSLFMKAGTASTPLSCSQSTVKQRQFSPKPCSKRKRKKQQQTLTN